MTEAGWRRITGAAIASLVLAGCVAPQEAQQSAAGISSPTRSGPPGAPPGTCWGRTVTPAVVQTVQEREEIKPAKVNPDGSIASLPVYRTVTRQKIITERRDNWFETPCPEVLTPEFIASLQRALQARGAYGGTITGQLDPSTKAAIQAFQRAEGPDSPVLTLKTAQQLGLVAVKIE